MCQHFAVVVVAFCKQNEEKKEKNVVAWLNRHIAAIDDPLRTKKGNARLNKHIEIETHINEFQIDFNVRFSLLLDVFASHASMYARL